VEPNKARKSRNLVAVVSLTVLVLALIVLWTCKGLHTARLSEFVRSDLPILDLNLKLINIKGQEITPEQSRIVDKTLKADQEAPEAPTQDCPELIGGDTFERSTLTEMKDRPEECPRVATWKVRIHPVAFSLYFLEPGKVLSLFNENSRVKELFQNRFFQGIFYEPLHSASIRAEDLNLQGLEGAFLSRLVREALQAHAELHYDISHGKKGFVFSFVRDECTFAAKALPIAVRTLARSGYRVPKLKEPILEMRVGLQRIFLTQYEERVYLANGLEGLLNVIESLRPPGRSLPETPLVLTARTEAFVDKLLPVMVGGPTWEVNLGIGVSEEATGVLQFAPGKFAGHLHPKLFRGVLAGIPDDTFAAVSTSFYLPPTMSSEEWKRLATQGPVGTAESRPEEAGVAILWDLTSVEEELSNVGIVVSNQTTPEEVDKFKQYFAEPGLTAECGGGTVFLAATSRNLLGRMKESCEGQSLSVLDWERGKRTKDLDKAQLLLFMSPATAVRELFLAGGARSGDAGDFEPQWKQQYEKAKAAMREDGEKVFGQLPIFAYAGNAVPTADVVQLKGFTVKQGGAR
jgi:hypothetical protein